MAKEIFDDLKKFDAKRIALAHVAAAQFEFDRGAYSKTCAAKVHLPTCITYSHTSVFLSYFCCFFLSGNEAKARKNLEKGMSYSAQPSVMLSIALQRLDANRKDLCDELTLLRRSVSLTNDKENTFGQERTESRDRKQDSHSNQEQSRSQRHR